MPAKMCYILVWLDNCSHLRPFLRFQWPLRLFSLFLLHNILRLLKRPFPLQPPLLHGIIAPKSNNRYTSCFVCFTYIFDQGKVVLEPWGSFNTMMKRSNWWRRNPWGLSVAWRDASHGRTTTIKPTQGALPPRSLSGHSILHWRCRTWAHATRANPPYQVPANSTCSQAGPFHQPRPRNPRRCPFPCSVCLTLAPIDSSATLREVTSWSTTLHIAIVCYVMRCTCRPTGASGITCRFHAHHGCGHPGCLHTAGCI